jgi:hypothetical protein
MKAAQFDHCGRIGRFKTPHPTKEIETLKVENYVLALTEPFKKLKRSQRLKR